MVAASVLTSNLALDYQNLIIGENDLITVTFVSIFIFLYAISIPMSESVFWHKNLCTRAVAGVLYYFVLLIFITIMQFFDYNLNLLLSIFIFSFIIRIFLLQLVVKYILTFKSCKFDV